MTNLLSAILQVEISLEELKAAADLYASYPTPISSALVELTRAQLVLVSREVPRVVD
ncbi:hypothetical protein [Rhodococcus sp. KBS0724]|uniref:hypothetical protein n=1 Tax=Rhodococcus sp. KBS0724 TaxID=1179674 RepID=UPI00163DCF54|nr:hypothetical protein [Rhodococcus sp. KBS0724]